MHANRCSQRVNLKTDTNLAYVETDRQCTDNVTLRCVRATIIAVEKTTCVRICSLRYPACNAHVPHCHLACPTLEHFSTLSHKWHHFQKNSY
jgi:hypothetical protein